MGEKELYQQKMRAQLDEWKADVDKLRAKASGASADAKLQLNQQVKNLEAKINEAKAKLDELANASDEAWNTVKAGVESSWGSLKSAFKDAASKFQK